MNFQIINYKGTIQEDDEITLLLNRVYVGEGYTEKSDAKRKFAPVELRKRGEIILAKSLGKLLGVIIFVQSSSPARQVAKVDEAEIHLLAVYPEVRGQGIASALIKACEQRAVSFGYSKMVLSTQKTMKEAQRVYEKLDYHRNPARDWFRGTDKIFLVYEKRLLI